MANDAEKVTHLKQQLNVEARHSNEALDSQQAKAAASAGQDYQKMVANREVPDDYDIDILMEQYKSVVPKTPSFSAKAEKQNVLANAKTGKYSKKLNDALLKEHEPDATGDKDDDKQNGDKKNRNDSAKGKSGGVSGGSLFQGLREAFKRPPLTDQLVKNNIEVRQTVHKLERASSLNTATQTALAAHLSTLDFDTGKGMRDIANQKSSAEAQQLMNDPKAQRLISDNDKATAYLMAQMNPQGLHATQNLINEGNVDPSLKKSFKEASESAVNALEGNSELPSNQQDVDPGALEALKEFVEKIKSMFSLGSGEGKQAGMGMS